MTYITRINVAAARRSSTNHPDEIPLAICCIALLAGAALIAPIQSTTIGQPIQQLTGIANTEDLIGHTLILAGFAAGAYYPLRLISTDQELRHDMRHIVVPLAVALPVMAFLFGCSKASNTYAANLPYESFGCNYLDVYRAVAGTAAIYILVFGIRAFMVVRRDARYKTVASLYVFAAGCAIATNLLYVSTAFVEDPAGSGPWRMGLFVVAVVIIFQAAVWSWRKHGVREAFA